MNLDRWRGFHDVKAQVGRYAARAVSAGFSDDAVRHRFGKGQAAPHGLGGIRDSCDPSVTDETVAAAARATSTCQHQVHGTTHHHNFFAKLQGDLKIMPDLGFTLRSDQREHIAVDS